jgi:hypothetical protein
MLWFMWQSSAYRQELRIHKQNPKKFLSDTFLITAETRGRRHAFTSWRVSKYMHFGFAYCTQNEIACTSFSSQDLGQSHVHTLTYTHTRTKPHAGLAHQGGKVSHSAYEVKNITCLKLSKYECWRDCWRDCLCVVSGTPTRLLGY